MELGIVKIYVIRANYKYMYTINIIALYNIYSQMIQSRELKTQMEMQTGSS